MKKTITILIICLVCILALCGFSACSENENEAKYTVVCTVFPAYDWARNVVGDNADVNVILLLDSGADLHSYNPTTRDMLNISKCDLFVYVGGESDEWVEGVLTSYPSDKRINLNLIAALGEKAREEEEIEGVEEEHEEHGGAEYDEHVWLSLKNAVVCVNAIADKVAAFDSENGEKYSQNASSYVAKLNDLDERYTQATVSAAVKTLVFCDRFPFLYMMKDYGLSYYAAFSGCSTETQASFNTIKFLADKVKELSLDRVIVLEGSDKAVARSVLSEAGVNGNILQLDSIQSVGRAQVDSGATYLSIMENNLTVIKKAVA